MAKSKLPRADILLVIEEGEPIAAELRALLAPEGYRVAIAGARQAMSAIGAIDRRCVVLLDPLLSGVTPIGLARALREGQTLITLALAVYPRDGHGGPPSPTPSPTDGRPRDKRLVSPALLLEMVRKSLGEPPLRSIEAARAPGAARCHGLPLAA
ncbi:MAG TPA: hypothetical protein VFF06_03320 [Polyangia bacterium]|nr:hypothetical protein [Polyangia bacterium]